MHFLLYLMFFSFGGVAFVLLTNAIHNFDTQYNALHQLKHRAQTSIRYHLNSCKKFFTTSRKARVQHPNPLINDPGVQQISQTPFGSLRSPPPSCIAPRRLSFNLNSPMMPEMPIQNSRSNDISTPGITQKMYDYLNENVRCLEMSPLNFQKRIPMLSSVIPEEDMTCNIKEATVKDTDTAPEQLRKVIAPMMRDRSDLELKQRKEEEPERQEEEEPEQRQLEKEPELSITEDYQRTPIPVKPKSAFDLTVPEKDKIAASGGTIFTSALKIQSELLLQENQRRVETIPNRHPSERAGLDVFPLADLLGPIEDGGMINLDNMSTDILDMSFNLIENNELGKHNDNNVVYLKPVNSSVHLRSRRKQTSKPKTSPTSIDYLETTCIESPGLYLEPDFIESDKDYRSSQRQVTSSSENFESRNKENRPSERKVTSSSKNVESSISKRSKLETQGNPNPMASLPPLQRKPLVPVSMSMFPHSFRGNIAPAKLNKRRRVQFSSGPSPLPLRIMDEL